MINCISCNDYLNSELADVMRNKAVPMIAKEGATIVVEYQGKKIRSTVYFDDFTKTTEQFQEAKANTIGDLAISWQFKIRCADQLMQLGFLQVVDAT